MLSLWNDQDAAEFAGDDLAMRVYTSRLLGASEDLVMHGGGNTSVKATTQDFFGNDVEVAVGHRIDDHMGNALRRQFRQPG